VPAGGVVVGEGEVQEESATSAARAAARACHEFRVSHG
jgi:hypothetical protein